MIADPIPNPTTAGWTKEGSESFTGATPLIINDANAVPNSAFPQPFCNFFIRCSDADFASELRLKPAVAIDGNFVIDSFGSTGVHVTLNDGFQQIQVALLQSGSGLKVSVATQSGFSPGLDLGGLGGVFVVRRTAAGDAIIEVGDRSETVSAAGLPASSRPGTKSIEFGTYDTTAASVARWTTLGLPKPTSDVPFSTFLVRELFIRDPIRSAQGVAMLADFTAGNGPPLDAAVDPVSLTLSRAAAPTNFWRANALMPLRGFERFNLFGAQLLLLNAAERQRTGIELFAIKPYTNVFFSDLAARLPGGDYANLDVEFRIGNQVGKQSLRLIEVPSGSGRWKLG